MPARTYWVGLGAVVLVVALFLLLRPEHRGQLLLLSGVGLQNIVPPHFQPPRTPSQPRPVMATLWKDGLVDSALLQKHMLSLPWLQANPKRLPYCSLSDADSNYFPKSASQRMPWPFGRSPSVGKCVPFIDLRADDMTRFYQDVCVRNYREEVLSWSKPDAPVLPHPQWWQESEASVQYCMLRHYKPRRVIEIGSGTSTRFAALALIKNGMEGHVGFLQSIDPMPRTMDGNTAITSQPAVSFTFDFLQQSVTDVPMAHFDMLEAGDVLFIDSSHIHDHKSDVRFEFNDLLPRLKPGVLIHIHDMPQPCGDNRHEPWNEQEVVMAMLAYNPAWGVLWHGKCMYKFAPEVSAKMHGQPKLDHSMWLVKLM
jgi:hypothetical protein